MAPRDTLKRFGYTALAAIIVARLSPSLNLPYRSTDRRGVPRDHLWTGRYGERVAASWLRSQGCKILYRNFRGPRGGEVDIVAREGRTLLFVEVKTRREGSPVRPLDAVGKDKQRLVERGAASWLKRLGRRDIPWRFDVVEVRVENGRKPRVNRVRDAF